MVGTPRPEQPLGRGSALPRLAQSWSSAALAARSVLPSNMPGAEVGAAQHLHQGLVIAQLVKLPAMQETLVRFLGQENLLEKG